jgi:tight adherence protein B
LATTIREQVTMRLRIEASRASARTAVRTIAGFSVGFLVLLAVFAHSYLEPFASLDGQAVLALIGGLFFLGLWLMARMARPRSLERLETWTAGR